ncbi:hypothetical protein [Desulfosarcina cetonica]|uniref:hypothetical protein n=1 Tax=Desulfosarcina cetonica TaxID=90730 RepID=UPI0012ED673A|nr:hypothetical protein [Desulfosarcina cetonica]
MKRFGKSIGNNNLVVWVKNPKTDGLNVEMGKTYADRLYRWYGYNLDYSSGPYLVYLTQNPNQPPNANDFAAIIGFKNKNYEDSIEAIEYLESQIRREKVKKEDVTMINYWIDLKSIARSNVDIIIDIAKNIGKK